MTNLPQAVLAAEKIGTKAIKHDLLKGLDAESQKLVWYTFNPFLVYNIRKWPAPKAFASQDPSFGPFMALLDDLANRKVTGNAAKAAVTATLGLYTEPTVKILERVLNKDLKCGASGDTFRKLYPHLAIPEFNIMLAAKIEEKAIALKKSDKLLTGDILAKKYGLTFPFIAEAKYDGNRLIAFVSNGKVQYLSRSGKDSDHLIGLFDVELAKMEADIGQPIVVDGEVLGGSFLETVEAKKSTNDNAKASLKFYAFDIMTRTEWDEQDCPHNQLGRTMRLRDLIIKLGLTKIVKSKTTIVKNMAELLAFYSEVIAEGHNPDDSLNGLGEGLILKTLHGFYEWDRSKNWFKWKPVVDLDLKIVGYKMGEGRLSTTIGKLLLEGYDENGTFIKASCGSGLSDKDRAFFLANQAAMLGKTVMIECQEISKGRNSAHHSARFPIFIRVRDDK